MKYDNRDYPHPVLGIGEDIDGKFSCNLTVKSDKEYTVLNPVITLKNETLEKLIDEGRASIMMHIYCRAAMFRKNCKVTDPLSFTIKIPTDDLSGETEVDFFICAEDDINNYVNSDADEIFGGSSFEIRKGYILAYGGKGKFYANKSPEKLKAISSFMRIKKGNFESGPFRLDYDDEKFITIILSKIDDDKYYLLKSNRENWNILHAGIVFPALLEAAYFVSDEDSGSTDFQETQWYDIFVKLLDSAKGNSMLERVQNILDLPLNRALTDIEPEI